jgi:hypothetical protein
LGVGRKADDLVLGKKIFLRNMKNWKPDQIWQNILRKATVRKGCFTDGDHDYC